MPASSERAYDEEIEQHYRPPLRLCPFEKIRELPSAPSRQ